MESSGGTVTKELETVLQREIMFQSWTAEWAWNLLNRSVEPHPLIREAARNRSILKGPLKIGDPVPQALINYSVILWSFARVMLAGASVVSRILWPLTEREPKDARERNVVRRAQVLRARWNVESTSYLANRDVRDVFEHVDEKLEKWMLMHPERPAQGLTIGAAADNPKFRETCFRLLDPTTRVVYARDKECDLGQLFSALRELSNRLPPIAFHIEMAFPQSWTV